MKINPTTICGVAGATLSIGAEFLFSRIYLIVRSTLRNHGCCYFGRRAISYSIAGIAGGAAGLAIAAIAYRAIPHIQSFMLKQAEGYYKEGMDLLDSSKVEAAAGQSESIYTMMHGKNLEAAVQQFEMAYFIFWLVHGENNAHVANCHFNIGRALSALNRKNEALPHYQDALKISKLTHGENNAHVANCHFNIGRVLSAVNRKNEALPHYQDALKISNLVYGQNSKYAADCLFNIGRVLLELDRYEKSRENFSQALNIYNKVPSDDNLEYIADCYTHIGNLCLLLKDNYEQSLESFSNALKIYLTPNQDSRLLQLAICHQCIGFARLQLKQNEPALDAIINALEAYKDLSVKNIIQKTPSWLTDIVIAIALKEHAFNQVSKNSNDLWDLKKELEPFIPLFEAEGVDTSQICLNAANALRKYGMEVDLSRLEAAINELRAPTDPA